ncbi:methyltransferase [Shewanella olleyana]|uniref:tRNA1(Val) (adenine(37)-N6)-methyltransferase n=1 Tax=Shewanella olleyana TaxID=135626 RepID=UPI00200D3E8B|nr:methyltransferase [Shewanella olleyana]MCL1068746.1 methyltransferase [Shewanella olleyana]
MPFTFKQFHIEDSHCGMPVSTDGVILGAWSKLPLTNQGGNSRILDIGAGSGLLSLMVAQRVENPLVEIQAVELEDGAVKDCQFNFDQSPWRQQLSLRHCSIQQFADDNLKSKAALFDSIICNPPYFDNGPQSEAKRRATARHTDSLSFKTLLSHTQLLLSQDGIASFIIPIQSELGFMAALSQTKLLISHRTTICTVETKAPSRLLLALKHSSSLNSTSNTPQQKPQLSNQQKPHSSNLVIADNKGQYTQSMSQLCRDFYLKL